MKIYWDSSALVVALQDTKVLERLKGGESVTRAHALAEVFSALTGGRLGFRVVADTAAEMLDKLAAKLAFVELDSGEVLSALKEAQGLAVMGGRVHDFLHARAARKAGAAKLLTLDLRDFQGLEDGFSLEKP